MTRQVHTAPTVADAERAALTAAASEAGTQPGAILYLAPGGRPAADVKSRWEELGTPIRLRTSDFDTVVTEAIEQLDYEPRSRGLSLEQRQRIVEAAVDGLDGQDHPLAMRDGPAGPEACAQAEDLLSLLEFAGLVDSAAIRTDERLEPVSTPVRDAITALSAEFDSRRDVFADERGQKTLQSERYQRVCTADNGLAAVLDPVDAVVLGPHPFYSPLEADLIDAIASEVEIMTAALPLAAAALDAPPALGESLAGIDVGASRAWQRYADLNFAHKPPAEPSRASGTDIAAACYRYQTGTELRPAAVEAAGIDWQTYPTPAHETRGAARTVRTALEAGRDTDEIGVVVTNLADRRREFFEVFSQYGIPTQTTEEGALDQTELGAVLSDAIRIGSGEGRLRDILRLLDNPLTDLSWPAATMTAAELGTIVGQLEVSSIAAAQQLLEREGQDDRAASLEWLTALCAEFVDAPTSEVHEQTYALLETLGVVTQAAAEDAWELDTTAERPKWARDQAQAARRELDRVLDSLAATTALDARNVGERLPRALATAAVEASIGDPDGIVLCSPTDVLQHEFAVTVVAGLTTEAFPSPPTRLAFTREINDSHPDFEPGDTTLRARYALGLLASASDRLVLSHPDQTPEGDQSVIADFLAELQRLCDGDLEPTQHDDGDQLHSREDIQRQVGRVLGARSQPDEDVATTAAESGAFETGPGTPATRLQAGITCAAARRDASTTRYDGRLSPETVEEFAASEAPLSPSRIDTYAACGFKFFASYLLDFESPETIATEPDTGVRGHFIHETVGRFFKSLQATPGEPVHIADPDPYHDALFEAAQTELNQAYVAEYESTFHDGWLQRLFSGLEPSSHTNPYQGPPAHRGLFIRFLESLAEEEALTSVSPAFFEAAIGLSRQRSDVTTLLHEEPVELVDGIKVRGKVDRVDIDPSASPAEFAAIDYKTGSSPSISNVRSGLSFQLPLYLRLLDAVLDEETDWRPVGAAYYDLKPPATAAIQKSPLASKDHTEHFGTGGEALLRAQKDSLFETQEGEDSLEEFLFETIDERLQTIGAALAEGIYHPTLLAADDAGCEHCDFAHVCDVRHHRRAERLEQHGLETAYVPPGATDSMGAEQ
ncbi:PD-(D/E)XK nuclease family protein [Haloglomus halophilum]|uniref:PD-(D/E)XK nuclease family protein n=1 Tax=Haloglomus halophilum TaxID=2962672 RepID=UPI0020C9E730|nr:PD-(D/E)XK nuclease family protein [Haloglomus halophilum]